MVGPIYIHCMAYGMCLTVFLNAQLQVISSSKSLQVVVFFFFSFPVKFFEGIGLTVLGRTEFNLFLSNQIMGKMPGKWLPNSWHCSEITELGEFVR